MIKKIILSFVTALTILISIGAAPAAVFAQQNQPLPPWYNQNFDQWYVKVFDPATPPNEIFGERYTYAQVRWVIWSIATHLLLALQGIGPKLLNCFSGDVATCLQASGPTPTLHANNSVTEIAAFIFADRPLSGISEVKGVIRKFTNVPEAQAQSVGFGYNALRAIRSLWVIARNITYVLFVFIFVITAFMIMFRTKISPQTVVSVQSALPRIFISLILVTFSYAIAGFVIDMMYVVIGLIALLTGIPFAFFITGVLDPNVGVGGILGMILNYLVLFFTAMAQMFATTTFGFGLLTMVIFVIVLIYSIFVFFKLMFQLFKASAFALIYTLIAPVQIALGAVMPGIGFSTWLREYIANLAVFPVTGLMFALAYIFLSIAQATAANPTGVNIPAADRPPVAGWPPLFSLGTGWEAFTMIGTSFIVFAMIPKASEMIKTMISGKPFAFGTAIGEATSPATGLGKSGGLYGLGTRITEAEGRARALGRPNPVWTQMARRATGLRG